MDPPYRSPPGHSRRRWPTVYAPGTTNSTRGRATSNSTINAVYSNSGWPYSSSSSSGVYTNPTLPIGVSYSSRSLAIRDAPSSPTVASRRSRLEEAGSSDSSSSSHRRGYSTGRRLSTADLPPVSASVSCQSSKLTRRIDSFLRTGGSSRYTGPGSPDLSLSGRGTLPPLRSSSSAASIAVKAGRHLEALVVPKKAPGGCGSTSESLDNLDSDSDASCQDTSEDTSADLSKFDDLSSDSDDEFFDSVPLGTFALERNPAAASAVAAAKVTAPKQTSTPKHTPPTLGPTHSQSVPAVNKLVPGKAAIMDPPAVLPTKPVKGNAQDAPTDTDRPLTPSPSLKKYPAPKPPGSISRQASSASIARPIQADECSVPNTPAAAKRCQRTASFKKYPAPAPPGVTRENSMISIVSAAAAALNETTTTKTTTNGSVTAGASGSITNGSVTAVTNGSVTSLTNGTITDTKSVPLTNSINGRDTKGAVSSNAYVCANNGTQSNGHIEDVLSAFKRGASDSLNSIKNGSNTRLEKTTLKSDVVNGGGDGTDRSRRSISRESNSKTGKLNNVVSKFETDTLSTSENSKSLLKSSSDLKARKFSGAKSKNKLGNLASKFESGESNSEVYKLVKSSSTHIGKIHSPYSKPFDVDPVIAPVVQRKSIGGINVSKFGGTGKFPTTNQLRKSSKAGIADCDKDDLSIISSNQNQDVNSTVEQTDDMKSPDENKSIATSTVVSTDIQPDSKSASSSLSDQDETKNIISSEIQREILTNPLTNCTGNLVSPEKCTIQTTKSVTKINISPVINGKAEISKISVMDKLVGDATADLAESSSSSQPGVDLLSASVDLSSNMASGTKYKDMTPAVAGTSGTSTTGTKKTVPSSSKSCIGVSTPTTIHTSTSVTLASTTSSAINANKSTAVSSSSLERPVASIAPTTTLSSKVSIDGIPPSSITYLSIIDNSSKSPISMAPCSSTELSTSVLMTCSPTRLSSLTRTDISSVSSSSLSVINDKKSDVFKLPDLSIYSSIHSSSVSLASQCIGLQSPSIFTRASSLTPSRATSPFTGLNISYGDDPYRARSLTPFEGITERRSVRAKSRFLSSDSQAASLTTSALDLEKPESALEKYRRRKELRNAAAKSTLDAMTSQLTVAETPVSGVTTDTAVVDSSGYKGIKLKIDLSGIKDFLRKTEEEISKLPRYIREPWTISGILGSTSSDKSTTVVPQIPLLGNKDHLASSPCEDSSSRKSSSQSMESYSQLKTSPSSGDEEVYMDATDAIDTSQMDTLMPLPDTRDLDRRCRSVTPSRVLANTEKVLSQTDRLLKKSRSGNSLRKSYSRSLSAANIERLSEVVSDLAEEHSTGQLAGERLEAEQADRMRLEKELDGAQSGMRALSVATERLEVEKSALRTEMLQHTAALSNGGIGADEDAGAASLYKRKFEWSQREVEALKQQLRQHQQDEIDQTMLVKKQLEKKVGDAREETEEQRQVAAQLKKRTQRLQAEMNDLKILLEEQAARNCLLEKKQRKFDSDLTAGQDELRAERLNKEKVARERDAHLAEKYSTDQELATLKLELEMRDERISSLTRQLDELSVAGQGDQEITQLKKTKHDLETKVKDQEEELDDLAGQVQMLEAARTRLEMSTEQTRKENRKEIHQRDEEVEEVRIAAQKKVKALEAQVETEHEERTQLVRDKHELERRLMEVIDRSSVQPDDDLVHRLKKDLRKSKALLKDTQTMLEKTHSEGPSKLIVRQLKTQLEDCEFAKTAALKARQSADADLSEMQSSLDDSQRSRKDAEDRASRLLKEKTEIQTQLEEGEELHAETLKKYKSTVSQVSVDQISLAEQSHRIAELEQEKQCLSERLTELSSKVEVLEGETANIHTQRMLQMKVKELESKLELELATRKRIESQVARLKEQIERVSGESDLSKLRESQSIDQTKKLNRQLRQTKEEAAVCQQRNTELLSKKQELEKQMELMDSETSTLKGDLKLAFKRIEDLQMALQGDISDSDSDLSDSDSDSDTSLSNYLTSAGRGARSASLAASPLRSPNTTVTTLHNARDDISSPGSDAMAVIPEAKEESPPSESYA